MCGRSIIGRYPPRTYVWRSANSQQLPAVAADVEIRSSGFRFRAAIRLPASRKPARIVQRHRGVPHPPTGLSTGVGYRSHSPGGCGLHPGSAASRKRRPRESRVSRQVWYPPPIQMSSCGKPVKSAVTIHRRLPPGWSAREAASRLPVATGHQHRGAVPTGIGAVHPAYRRQYPWDRGLPARRRPGRLRLFILLSAGCPPSHPRCLGCPHQRNATRRQRGLIMPSDGR